MLCRISFGAIGSCYFVRPQYDRGRTIWRWRQLPIQHPAPKLQTKKRCASFQRRALAWSTFSPRRSDIVAEELAYINEPGFILPLHSPVAVAEQVAGEMNRWARTRRPSKPIAITIAITLPATMLVLKTSRE